MPQRTRRSMRGWEACVANGCDNASVRNRPGGHMTRLLRHVIGVLVMFGLAVGVGPAAGAATASAAFCSETIELQGWISQGFRPGVDQYEENPNRSTVESSAQYLRRLSEQAPAAIKADLVTWATFTEQVADGASQAELAEGAGPARAAAERVDTWLATSGCVDKHANSAPQIHHNGHPVLVWIAIGAGVVLVLTVLGAVGGGGRLASPAAKARPGRSPMGNSGLGSSGAEKCGSCSGGKITCGPCQGRGYHDHNTPQANGVYANTTSRCSPCGGSGKIACQMCHGTGVRR